MFFFYKQYKDSAAATLANAFIRMIGLFSLFAAYICFQERIIPGIILSIILIILSVPVSNIVGNKIAFKAAQKKAVKEANTEMVLEVPDVVPGEFTYPAKITIFREKSFVGCAVRSITYIINNKTTFQLHMNQSETYTTCQAENQILAKAPVTGDKESEHPINVVVRPGEQVTLYFVMNQFKRIERKGME